MRKQNGFTLFDIMLAMVIASMIAVGVAKVASNKAQSAADKVFGENLFTYSQAAYLCAYNHIGTTAGLVASGNFQGQSATLNTGNFWSNYGLSTQQNLEAIYPNWSDYNKGYQYTGTSWLSSCTDPNTGAYYLPSTFSFASNMDQLLVLLSTPATPPTTTPVVTPGASIVSPAAAIQGNNALTTYILYSTTKPADPPLVFVVAGALYQADRKVPNQYDLQPGLTGEGVSVANALLGSIGSSNPFTFTYLRNSLGVTAPVFGYLTSGALQVPTGTSSQYLLTEGYPAGNSMQGTLAIDTTATCSNDSYGYLDYRTCTTPLLTFPSNSGTITGLNSLTMNTLPPCGTDPTNGSFNLLDASGRGIVNGIRVLNLVARYNWWGSGLYGPNFITFNGSNATYTGSNTTIDMGSVPVPAQPLPVISAGQSQILNLTTLNFDYSSSASIMGLETITFNGASSTINMNRGKICGLPYNAQSTGLGSFQGVYISPLSVNGWQRKVAAGNNFPWANSLFPSVTNSYCVLTDIETDNINDTKASGECKTVIIPGSGSYSSTWGLEVGGSTNGGTPTITCSMTCITW